MWKLSKKRKVTEKIKKIYFGFILMSNLLSENDSSYICIDKI